MKREDWEKIQQYDLSTILEDCSFTSSEKLINAIEKWWNINDDFILKACLEKVNKSNIMMNCPVTNKREIQIIIRETEDGIFLKCEGCGKEHSHEIGEIRGC